jgi:uncharacterized protein YdaU (DUF1376 family)
MKDRLPWFKCNPGALLSAMAGLSADENLTYITILLRIYETGGPVQETPRTIARRCGLTVPKAEAAIKGLIEFGKISQEGGFFDSASTHETLAEMEEARKGASSAGKASAAKRAEKDKQNQQNDATPVERPLNDCLTTKDRRVENKDSSLRSESLTASCDAPGGLLELVEPSADRTLAARIEEAFERLRTVYPKRDGSQPRKPAFEKFARLVSKGVDPERIIAAAEAYRAEVRKHGKEGTPFVKQVQFWLSDAPWEQLAPAPSTNASASKPMHPDEWRALVRTYISTGGNWAWRGVSPEPGKPGCRVPHEILGECRDQLKRVMPPGQFAAAFGIEFAGAAE